MIPSPTWVGDVTGLSPSVRAGWRAGTGSRWTRFVAPLVPRMMRVPLYTVAEVDVARAVPWLDERWGGGVSIPEELQGVAAVA